MAMVKKSGAEGAKTKDDSLFGLLSSYKLHTAYFRLLVSEAEGRAAVHIADNPRSWSLIPPERYAAYKPVRRHELGTTKLSVKYLTAKNIITYLGPLLGLKLPKKKTTVINNLDREGYFVLEIPLASLPVLLQVIKRIITLSPQRKYEILEKSLVES
jgi:hypothetical protein